MIPLKVKCARGLKEQISGLIGQKKAKQILFKTRWGIHTFGLKFPIDVIVLDQNNRVIKLKENLKPNNIFFWNPRFDTVIELPKGTIRKSELTVGKTILLSFL